MRRPRTLVLGAVLGLCPLLAAGCVPPPSGSADSVTNATLTTPTVIATTTTAVSTSERLLVEARQFVYRVRNVACLATGTSFTTTDGFVTNRHVASGANVLELSNWEGMDFQSAVQSISPGPDLALLDDNFNSDAVASLSTTPVAKGTELWVAGYPKGDQLSVTSGTLIDYTAGSRYDEPGRLMEITDPIEPGNSGSPLFDRAGDVVGVVFAIETKTGDGLAIPASTLSSYLVSPGDDTFGDCIA
jgi:S1-C subfamily serine protease